MTKVLSFIHKNLTADVKAVWLYVIESKGSSPGRKSFQMVINENGKFTGTIGGGIMEVKLIALAKDMLLSDEPIALLKKQFHHKENPKQRSGMICSGEQTIVLMPLTSLDLITIQELMSPENLNDYNIIFSHKGMRISEGPTQADDVRSETEFRVSVSLKAKPLIHIFGAGHVGMAAAKQFAFLDREVILYDNRADLMRPQDMEHLNCLIDYEKINDQVQIRSKDVVIIVSHSYRDDKVILKQLYDASTCFIGIMGSDAKLAYLWRELKDDGIEESDLAHIKAPIGLPIYSKSAAEIAVSIAAEVINELNKDLPTGRGTYVE